MTFPAEQSQAKGSVKARRALGEKSHWFFLETTGRQSVWHHLGQQVLHKIKRKIIREFFSPFFDNSLMVAPSCDESSVYLDKVAFSPGY